MAWIAATDALWRTLRRPWLLMSAAIGLALVLLGARVLPQLPGQLSGEPTAAARWLAGASAEYGMAGEILRGLGLFNASHSLLLQLLLATIALGLFVLLGDAVAAALQLRRLGALLEAPAQGDAEPLALPTTHMLYRRREAVAQSPDGLASQLYHHLSERFDQVAMASPAPAEFAQSDDDRPEQTPKVAPDGQELRILALRNSRGALLQPVLWLAALLAVSVVWWVVTTGWDVTSPPLAPGDEYSSSAHALSFHYRVENRGDGLSTQLLAQVGAQTVTLPVAANVAQSVAGVDVAARAALPGLYITTEDGAATLARAGQTETAAGLGLAFPGPGSEESVILPHQGIGLRLIRMADGATEAEGAFMLEVYEGESDRPTQRVVIGGEPTTSIALNDDGLALRLIQMPVVVARARYAPGLWLLGIAALLALVGLAGFWRRPALLLAQIAPWPAARALLIAQSDAEAEIAELPLSAPTSPSTSAGES